MRVTGQVIGIEPYSGDFVPEGETEKVPYHGQKVSVFDGREVIKVKVKAREISALGDLKRGDECDLLVDVAAAGGARGIYLTVTFVERLDTAPHLASVSQAN